MDMDKTYPVDAVMREFEHVKFPDLTGIQVIEMSMLLDLGVTVGDLRSALDAWLGASHVRDDWAWIRTLLFTRLAEWRLREVELRLSLSPDGD